jgi:plastocyanin
MSTALIVTSSIQADAGEANPGEAGYAASFPPAGGPLVAWVNVVPVTCPAQAPNAGVASTVTAMGKGDAALSLGLIVYLCNDGTPSFQAEISTGNRLPKTISVSPGDVVRFVFQFGLHSVSEQKVLTVQDKTSGASANLTRKSFAATQISVEANGAGSTRNIPAFGSMRFYRIFLNGQPLSALPGLVSENMLNNKGNIMVRTSGLTTNGDGFSTTFVRSG